MIEVEGLTVRYGGVTSLDAMSLAFAEGTCGLIGPNGAGKTTFFNVLSGFVRPAAGTVRASGVDLLSMAHFRRARWGVRRTFQTEQAIEELSVFDNLAMVHEHSRLGRASRRQDVLDAISFVGLEADPETKVRTLGAGQRRLVEVARAVVGPGWSCSTSPPPACPTRRPATWARSSAASPSTPGRWSSWSTTT